MDRIGGVGTSAADLLPVITLQEFAYGQLNGVASRGPIGAANRDTIHFAGGMLVGKELRFDPSGQPVLQVEHGLSGGPDTLLQTDLAAETGFEVPMFMGKDCGPRPGRTPQRYEAFAECSERAMLEHIYMNVQYPLAARERGAAGAIAVTFVVEADGRISDAYVEDTKVDRDLASAAVAVVSSMPNWHPARINGDVAATVMRLNVNFKMENSYKVLIQVD